MSMANEQRPALNLKVGDTVLQRRGYGAKAREAQEYVEGIVTAVHRVYAQVAFDPASYRNGKYRLDNGAPQNDRQGGYITTQARLDYDARREAAYTLLNKHGFNTPWRSWNNDAKIFAVAAALERFEEEERN